MTTMTLERATEFMRLVDNGQISGRISEWPGLRKACGTVYAHLAQPAQAVDVGAARLQARADEIERAVACGEMDVYQVFTQMRQLLPRALSGEKAGPVGDGWKPTDDDVRGWLLRSDLEDNGRIDHWRTVIDDARSMHLLAAAPSQPKDAGEVES